MQSSAGESEELNSRRRNDLQCSAIAEFAVAELIRRVLNRAAEVVTLAVSSTHFAAYEPEPNRLTVQIEFDA